MMHWSHRISCVLLKYRGCRGTQEPWFASYPGLGVTDQCRVRYRGKKNNPKCIMICFIWCRCVWLRALWRDCLGQIAKLLQSYQVHFHMWMGRDVDQTSYRAINGGAAPHPEHISFLAASPTVLSVHVLLTVDSLGDHFTYLWMQFQFCLGFLCHISSVMLSNIPRSQQLGVITFIMILFPIKNTNN